jgi:hypothetical protein
MNRSIRDALILLLAVAAGAWLRFSHLAAPSFWLDEILGYDLATRAAHMPLLKWISGIESENGALYYACELAGRAFHSIEFSARVAPALFGVMTIVVAWMIEPIFALLIACAPLHVYYSREARPYALLLLIATALLFLGARASRPPSSDSMAGRPRSQEILLLIAAAYTSATSFPLMVTCAIAALFLRRWRVAIAAAICAAAIPLLYRGGAQLPSFPPWTPRLFRDALDSFSAVAVDHTHLHRIAWFFLAFAVIGAVDACRRDRRRAFVIIAFAILPAAISLAALWRLNHFYAVRYLAASLPGFLLLVATGIIAVASLARRAAPVVAPLIAIAIMRDGFIAARAEPYQKLDWREIAASVAQHAHHEDAVIASNDWTYTSLGFYLRPSPHIQLFDALGSTQMAEIFALQHPRAWLVDAGAPTLGDWLCRYPLLLATPRESLRLHYSPSRNDFLASRASASEQRTLITNAIGFGPEDDVYLGSGWDGPEPEDDHFARWAVATTATIALPLGAPRDHDVTIDVDPIHYRNSPPQHLALLINGSRLTDVVLRDERQTIAIHAPRDRWREGVNMLTFTFDHAVAPATIDPASSDHRELSARFSRVALDDAQPTGALRRARLALFLDDKQRKLKLPPDLVAFADESLCLDDDQFVRDAFAAINGRRIDAASFKTFRTMLTKGIPRSGVLRAIAHP